MLNTCAGKPPDGHHAEPYDRARPRQGRGGEILCAHLRGEIQRAHRLFRAGARQQDAHLAVRRGKKFDSHHYAFHVSKKEFDAIFKRIQQAGIAYGSASWSLDDGELNDWGGGRGLYFEDPNGHVLELMTVPQ